MQPAVPFPQVSYIAATGGTITEVGGYRYHTFTTSDDFEVTSLGSTDGSIEYLIVAGGGGGGGSDNSIRAAGGGGAGEVKDASTTVSVGTYAVVIGGGGAGGSYGNGTAGSNSSIGATAALGGGFGAGASVR